MSGNNNNNRVYDAESNTFKDNNNQNQNDTVSREKKVKRDSRGNIIEDTETTQSESNK